jgi:chaperonin GroES
MKNEIIPRGLWVLVEPVEEDIKKTTSGILLPQTEESEQKAQGMVIAIGEEVKGLKVGDKVIYGAYAGEQLKTIEDEKEKEYKLLLDEDIIAFIK